MAMVHQIIVALSLNDHNACFSWLSDGNHNRFVRSITNFARKYGAKCRTQRISNTLFLDVAMDTWISGGKGGFGANLRNSAKQKGNKQTTDFGDCRDLSGRRLRHINHEIILSKWKEAQDSGKPFDVDQLTGSGINLWFLSAPTWADKVKVDKNKRFKSARHKSSMCRNWVQAREGGRQPPAGASEHWGCPRGRSCPFAHGIDDLKDESRVQFLDDAQAQRNDDFRSQMDAYVQPLAREDAAVHDMIMQGLSASKKRARVETSPQAPAASAASDGVSITAGTMISERNEAEGLWFVTGCSAFSTCIFTCSAVTLQPGSSAYYEAELLSGGLMQLGWCEEGFGGGDEEQNDGVGDDARSYAFDGSRAIFIHAADSRACRLERVWQAGDVVGCAVEVSASPSDVSMLDVSLSFTLQNRHVVLDSTSSSSSSTPSSSSSSTVLWRFQRPVSAQGLVLFPALSLESEESVAVNMHAKPPVNSAIDFAITSTSGDNVASEIVKDTAVAEASSEVAAASNAASDAAIDWSTVHEWRDLLLHSAVALKIMLQTRGVKCGGTHEERAQRLFSIKDKRLEDIDRKLWAKK